MAANIKAFMDAAFISTLISTASDRVSLMLDDRK